MTRYKRLSSFAIGLLAALSCQAHADIDVYGQLHLSADRIDNGSIGDTTMTSNASHLGFKGEHELNYGFKAMWDLDSNIDVAGERDWLTARNRYIGLKHQYGTIIAGYHDTPMKSMAELIDVWPETIGDRRNIIGSGNGVSSDIRARNSGMYISPKIFNWEWRFMGSVGGDNDPTMDSQYLLSSTLIYDSELGFFGVGAERQMQTELARNHIRAVTGVRFAGIELSGFYEYMVSDKVETFDRQGYGGSATYTLFDTSLRMQAYYAGDYKGQAHSDAVSYSVGLSQRFSKRFEVYLIYAQTINGENASFALGAGEHGDTYFGENPGDDIYGISGGIKYGF